MFMERMELTESDGYGISSGSAMPGLCRRHAIVDEAMQREAAVRLDAWVPYRRRHRQAPLRTLKRANGSRPGWVAKPAFLVGFDSHIGVKQE